MGKLFLILLVLIGAAITIPTTRAKITDAATPFVDRFRTKMAAGRLETMAEQLDVRLSRGSELPTNWEGWLRRDYSHVPEDPWGNLYYLAPARRGYTVGSMGPDGVRGTPDDIKVERRQRR